MRTSMYTLAVQLEVGSKQPNLIEKLTPSELLNQLQRHPQNQTIHSFLRAVWSVGGGAAVVSVSQAGTTVAHVPHMNTRLPIS